MPVDKFGGSTAEKRSPCSTAVRYLEGTVSGDINMTGHRVTGLSTDLPTSDSDAASWTHVVHLVAEATTNNGTVPEGPLYLTNKRYIDEKDSLCVLKSGDTMTGNLQLSAGSDLVRLLGCTDLTPGKGFSVALGNLQNQIQYEVIAPPQTQTPLTLKTTHGFLIQSNDSDVIRIGVDTTMVYSNITMNNRRILNLPEPSSDNEAATKSYVDSRKQLITVWAKEKGTVNEGQYEWSFGNGSDGRKHAECGYTMLAPGQLLRMGLTACGNRAHPFHSATVNLVVNGAVHQTYSVTKPAGQYSGTRTFSTLFELMQGDRMNFKSMSTNSQVVCGVVCVLIELNL